MGYLASIFAAGTERDLLTGDRGWQPVGGWSWTGVETASGKRVTPDNALRNSAMWRGIDLKSGLVASFPCKVMQELPSGSREIARRHPVKRILGWRPNRWQSSYQFRQMLEGHRILRGNAYAAIQRTRDGNVSALVPLHPDRVKVTSDQDGMPLYTVNMGAGKQPVRLWWMECLHLTGKGLNGFLGLDTSEYAAEAIGLAQAGEEYAARVYSSGGAERGILKHKGAPLSPEKRMQLKEQWQSAYGPSSEAYKVAVLEEDLEWQKIGVTPEQAQGLQGRSNQVIEIGRFLGIPPWLLFETTKDTSWGSGLEQTNLAFLIYSQQPDLINWEQRMLLDLFDEEDIEAGYYPHFVVEALLRGDSAARAAFYRTMREIGVFSVDDILAKEDMPLVGGAGGSERCRPMNWVPIGTPASAAASGGSAAAALPSDSGSTASSSMTVLHGQVTGVASVAQESTGSDDCAAAAGVVYCARYRALLRSTLTRIYRRAIQDLPGAERRGDLAGWSKAHARHAALEWEPVLLTLDPEVHSEIQFVRLLEPAEARHGAPELLAERETERLLGAINAALIAAEQEDPETP